MPPKTQEELLEEELSQLSDEELAEYEAELTKSQETSSDIDLTVGLEDIGRDVQQSEDASMGAIEGVPYAKDAIAAGQALFDDSEQDFSQKYDIKKQEIQDEINQAKARSPYAFMGGEIATGMAMPVKGLKSAMAYGALGQHSRSEERSVTDLFEGMAYGYVGEKVGKGISKGLTGLKDMATSSGKLGILEAAGALNPRSKAIISSFADKHYYSEGMKHEEVLKKFSDDVLSLSVDDGQPLLKRFFQSPYETAKRALRARENVGKGLGKILQESSDNLPKLDGEEVFNRMVQEMDLTDDAINALQDKGTIAHKLNVRETLRQQFLGKPKRIKTGVKTSTERINTGVVDEFSQPVYKEITTTQDVFDEVPQFKEFSLKQLHELKTQLGNRLQRQINKAKLGGVEGNMVDEDVLLTMGKLSEVISDGVGEGADDATKAAYKELNRKYQVALMVEDLALKHGHKTWEGPFGAFKEVLSTRGMMAGITASAMGAPAAVSGGVLVAINKFSRDPRTPSALAKGALKIGEFIKTNPNTKFAERLIINAQLSSEDLRKAMLATAGEINLIETAVARDSDDALKRSDDILAAARFKDEELANQMQEVFESGNADSIGAYMDGLSKDPELGKYFEPGIGFNGKVYDPQDKAMLEEQLRANDDIPYAQKLQLIDDLNKNGTIPQPQEQAPDFMEFMTRNKDKPEY